MKPSIVYILGVGHSGTTILQYLLAAGAGTLGLGEVRKLANDSGWQDNAGTCSCGLNTRACPVWSDLQPATGQSETAWYRRLVDTLSQRHPEGTRWIDSSKTPEGLQSWLALQRDGVVGDIRVLYLVRDVRGWVVSDEKVRQRKGRRKRPALASILSWWRAQTAMDKFLVDSRLDYHVVSYEAVVFRTQAVMAQVGDYTGIDKLEENWENGLRQGEVHDVFGNRVKNDTTRRSRLVYEDEWQYRAGLNLLSVLAWPAWRMNARLRRSALGT